MPGSSPTSETMTTMSIRLMMTMKMTAFSSLYVTHILIFQNQLFPSDPYPADDFTKDEATLPLCVGTLIFMFIPVYGFMLMTLRQVTLLWYRT